MKAYASKALQRSCNYLGGETYAQWCNVICQPSESKPVAGWK